MKLETDIKYLKGVGEKRATKLRKLGIRTVKDLLLLKPRKYIDRRHVSDRIKLGEEIVLEGRVVSKGVEGDDYVVLINTNGNLVELVWKKTPYILKQFNVGDRVLCVGRVYSFRGKLRMLFPEYDVLDEDGRSSLVGIVPVYPLTEGITNRFLRELIKRAMQIYREEIETLNFLPEEIREKRNIPTKYEVLRMLHFPRNLSEAKSAELALAYEELFFFFINLYRFANYRKMKAYPIVRKGTLTEAFLKELPFKLTSAQERVIREIEEDMSKDIPMHRLLQGDVGSGKTIVAIYASLLAVENGYQTAIMVPTEILAEQIYSVIKHYTSSLNVNIALLTSSIPEKHKLAIYTGLATGSIDIVVGTHAIITESVRFKKLALAIVDEQHRFGVNQRLKLIRKAKEFTPHFLVMTATPIPRTLALTIYGDLDVSILDERPHRTQVITRWVYDNQRDTVYDWLFGKLKHGNQAYVVAPLVEKSEKLEAKAVEEIYEYILKRKPQGINVAIVHGRMKAEERQRIMQDFREGKYHILVATTVIEVGIDVPNATIMVIEHAERFGLSQLHQLRGRVMRSEGKAYCILITPRKVSEEARMRLKALVEYDDGFKLSEIDLRLRGPGELLGRRQHGYVNFRFADIVDTEHRKVIVSARRDALEVLRYGALDERIVEGLKEYHAQEEIVVG